MEVLVTKRRLPLEVTFLQDLQEALLNVVRLDQRWLTERKWDVRHSDDSNFVDEDADRFIEFCKSKKIEELIAAETTTIFNCTGMLDARSFPCCEMGLSQALYGLPAPLNMTHKDRDWLFAAAMGVNLIFSQKLPWHFLVLRDAAGMVTIAGTKEFIEHMTIDMPYLWWTPGLPPWMPARF